MAASRDLRVDVAGVHGAGVTAAGAASSATPAAPAVTPCAADAASVQVASGFAGRIGALGFRTTAANLKTGAAAARLHADADAYEMQDGAGAAGLADAGATVGQLVQVPDVPTPPLPAVPAPPGAPGGIVPITGPQISAVVHSGPGPQGLLMTAGMLDTQAVELEQAAASVRAASSETTSSWSSGAAEAAEAHLVDLESSYSDQATQARSLASQMRGHADDFARAKAVIPPPQVFDDLQRRLQAAYAANAHPASMGRFSGQIADLQYKLGAANHDALDGYGRYQDAAQIKAATIDPHGTKPDTGSPAPADDPVGAGGAQETNHAGTDTQTLDPADPLADPAAFGDAGQAATGLMQTVLPAVLGAVSGAAGGLLGAVSGAGQQLQQAGSQALGGLAQGANAAMGAGKPSDPGSGGGPQMPSAEDFDPDLGGSGGPQPGDTEPAAGGGGGGAGGPLSAPAGAPAAAAAAPATFSATPAPAAAAATGTPMGGAMMPPMMPMAGRPGGGAGEDDRRLYPEQRMRIETPPNSEPVRGRREARRIRGDKTAEGDDER
jgi:hypothetical protein